jgi:hypothetical protein
MEDKKRQGYFNQNKRKMSLQDYQNGPVSPLREA